MNFWLIKSEGSCYSIDDLKRDKKTAWTGIRNYQSRNFMMKDPTENSKISYGRSMRIGDLLLFYHSSSDLTGVYGIAKVSSKAHPDETALDKKDEHFDPKSTKENPIWYCVDISFVKKFSKPITLPEMKKDKKLSGIMVLKKGSRLSIQPVSENHFKHILSLR